MTSISYFVYEEDQYIPTNNYSAGESFTDEDVNINIQVWNNRWGVTDVDSINNVLLSIEFDTIEDSSLLEYCSLTVGSTIYPIRISDKIGTVALGRSLSGVSNDGDPDNINNIDNYINLTLTINLCGHNIKENDIKRLFFKISEQS